MLPGSASANAKNRSGKHIPPAAIPLSTFEFMPPFGTKVTTPLGE